MDLSSLVLLATVAGYGDPVDGFPSHQERALLLWTNAARVAPLEFEDEYEAGFEPCTTDDFADDEKVAKAPYYIDLDLTEVARVHSTDMVDNGCFQHESCDGTDPFVRIAQYYTDSQTVGENIAWGTTDPRYAVMGMWMCSTQGHRANIMSGDFNEMGPGIDSNYLTQDFGQGTLSEGAPPVRMAVDDGGPWYADWGDVAAPQKLELVIEGVENDMALTWGQPEQGIYSIDDADVVTADGACKDWYVYWETASGAHGTFPEEGSYLLGDCDGQDWRTGQSQRGGLFGDVAPGDLHTRMLDDVTLTGCDTTGGAGGLGLLGVVAAAALGLRRKRA